MCFHLKVLWSGDLIKLLVLIDWHRKKKQKEVKQKRTKKSSKKKAHSEEVSWRNESNVAMLATLTHHPPIVWGRGGAHGCVGGWGCNLRTPLHETLMLHTKKMAVIFLHVRNRCCCYFASIGTSMVQNDSNCAWFIHIQKSKRETEEKHVIREGQNSLITYLNASSYAVFSHVRHLVLQTKLCETYNSRLTCDSAGETDAEDEEEAGKKEDGKKMPVVVGLGVKGVFTIVCDIWHTHPQLCLRALKEFLNILQGQSPAGLRDEPQESTGMTRCSGCCVYVYRRWGKLSVCVCTINIHFWMVMCAENRHFSNHDCHHIICPVWTYTF